MHRMASIGADCDDLRSCETSLCVQAASIYCDSMAKLLVCDGLESCDAISLSYTAI